MQIKKSIENRKKCIHFVNTWSPAKRITTCSGCLPAVSHWPHRVKSPSHSRHLYTKPTSWFLQLEQIKLGWGLPWQLPVTDGLVIWINNRMGFSWSSKWPLVMTLKAANVSLILSHGMAILSFSSSGKLIIIKPHNILKRKRFKTKIFK